MRLARVMILTSLLLLAIPLTTVNCDLELVAISDAMIRQGTSPFTGDKLDDNNYGTHHDLSLGKAFYRGKCYSRGRIVLNFDLTGVSCPVIKAELVLTAKRAKVVMVRVFPLRKGFVESEVTWERAKSGDPWNGGDYDPSDELDHEYFSYLLAGDEVRLDVTEWVRANKGRVPEGLILDSGGSDGNLTVYSRETAYPPKLVIKCFTLKPPVPGPVTSTPTGTASTTTSATTTTSSPPTTTGTTTSTSTTTSIPGADFYLRVSPTYLQVKEGSQAIARVEVGRIGAPQRVGLRVIAPEGVGHVLSPKSGTTPFTAELNLSGSRTGVYEVRVVGESISGRREAVITLEVVSQAKPFFTLEVSPPFREVRPGEEAIFLVRVRGYGGFSDRIELRAGKGWVLNVSSGVPPFTSELRRRIPEGARPGVMVVRVEGISGKLRVRDEAVLVVSEVEREERVSETITKETTHTITTTLTGPLTSQMTETVSSEVSLSRAQDRGGWIIALAVIGLALLAAGVYLLTKRGGG